jgi:hypothetical protein
MTTIAEARKSDLFVIPAKAGIYEAIERVDSCFRRNDDLPGFERDSRNEMDNIKWFPG